MIEPLVSIIVPVYNVEMYLYRCLKSIKNQTYTNIEVLMVDDGSTDGSGKICDSFAKEDMRFKVFHLTNGGVSKARNFALDRIYGEYCTFVDSDDIISPHYISCFMLNLYSVVSVKLYTVHYSLVSEKTFEKMFSNIDHYETSVKCKRIDKIDFMSGIVPRAVIGTIFSSNLLAGIRFNETISCGEDTLFMAQVLKKSQKIYLLDEELYAYIQYPKSLSHGSYNYQKFTELIAWEKVCNLFDDKDRTPYISSRAAFAYRCILRIDDMVDNYIDNREYIVFAKKNARRNARYIFQYPMNLGRKLKLTIKCLFPEIQVLLCKKRRNIK